MKKCIYITGIFVLLLSCKKDRLKDDKEIFIGTWEWQHAVHKYDFCDNDPNYSEILTPENIGNNYSIEFLKKGLIKYYENSSFLEQDRLVFTRFKESSEPESNFFEFSVLLDNKKDDVSKSIEGYVNPDTLIFIRGFPFSSYKVGCETYLSLFTKTK